MEKSGVPAPGGWAFGSDWRIEVAPADEGSDDGVVTAFFNIEGGETYLSSTTIIDDGEWHNVVVVIDRTHLTYMYVDGELESTFSSSLFGGLTRLYRTTGDFEIARNFNGVLDDVFLINADTLFPGEVALLYELAK